MERFDVPENEPIEFGFVTKAVAEAQAKVEGANFDIRKHLLEYDDVLNKQRGAIYQRRQEFMGMLKKEDVARAIADAAFAHWEMAWPTITAPARARCGRNASDERFDDPAADAQKKSRAQF